MVDNLQFISLYNFLRPVSAGVLCPAGVHPSVSMISKSVIYFPFFCPIPFFFKNPYLYSVPLPSILSLFSTLLSPCSPMSDSSIFFTLHDLLCFLPSNKLSACQGTNCGSCMHRETHVASH